MIGRAVQPVMKLISIIFRQLKWVSVPLEIMATPFRLFSNTFLRKGEIYADSFAAAYGYGPEQVSALAKLDRFVATTSMDLGPITNVFNDLNLLQREIITTVYMGHGSTLQRALRMKDSLDASLSKSGLSQQDKDAIIKERDRMMKVYNDYISMGSSDQETLCRAYRSMIDSWYNGKSYIIPPIDTGMAATYAD